jgi:hypothetical protein
VRTNRAFVAAGIRACRVVGHLAGRFVKPLEFERFGNCDGFAVIKLAAMVLNPSNSMGLETRSAPTPCN